MSDSETVDAHGYKAGRLTLAGMQRVINSGGTVLHNGAVLSKAEHLPTESQLAKTPEERAQAAKDIDAEIAALQARKAAMIKGAPKKPADLPPAPPEDDEEPEFAGHPLSYFADLEDDEIRNTEGVGQATFEKIKAALAAK